MIRVGSTRFDLDDVVELAALVCRAPSAVALMRDAVTNEVSTIARYGFIQDFTNNPPPARLIEAGETFIISRDVQNDARFKGHQLQTILPRIKTVIGVQLTQPEVKGQIVIGVFNAPVEFLDNDREFARYVKLVMMLQGQFEDVKDSDLVAALNPYKRDGLQEPVSNYARELPSIPVPMDPAAIFLFDTLIHKHSLHVRNGAPYISLRSWRKPIKEHQISALAAVKLFPPDNFIKRVSAELAENAVKLYGANSFTTVVPVPGGSSSSEQSLSEKLAIGVAKELSLPCVFALTSQITVKGKSHPSKSAKLQPYALKEPVDGSTLLIDDVSTSGRHIELAHKALRAKGNDCFALCWIGP